MHEKQSVNVEACPVCASHEATAYMPVSIDVFAEHGTPTVDCCGDPQVTFGETPRGGDSSCDFTVSQRIQICIPMAFGADVTVGSSYVLSESTAALSCGDSCACSCADTDDECD